MTYIPPQLRTRADTNPLFGRGDPAILAYRLSQVLKLWLPETPRYADLAASVGVLVSTKEEFVRKVVEPFLDDQLERNGDVWGRGNPVS